MSNKNKKTERFVTLGDAAYSFYDASTGIFICKGDKKKLTARQLNSPKIKKALHNGHLQYAVNENSPKAEKYDENAVENLKTRFESMVEKGMESTKIAQAFSDEEVDKIAGEYGLARDKDENSVAVIQSIIDELEGNKE